MRGIHKTMIFGTAMALTMGAVGFVVAAEGGGSKETFLKAAIESHLGEVEMGRLAQSKGYSQAVKDLGGTLVADHTAANTRAVALAIKEGVAVPTAASKDMQETLKELRTYNGKDFDVEFIDAAVEGHEDALELYKDEADNKEDGAVATYAAEVIPVLQKHLDAAKGLDK